MRGEGVQRDFRMVCGLTANIEASLIGEYMKGARVIRGNYYRSPGQSESPNRNYLCGEETAG